MSKATVTSWSGNANMRTGATLAIGWRGITDGARTVPREWRKRQVMNYVYMRSEPNLWTVGFYRPDGRWESESDHETADAAADRVCRLNGTAALEARAGDYAAGTMAEGTSHPSRGRE